MTNRRKTLAVVAACFFTSNLFAPDSKSESIRSVSKIYETVSSYEEGEALRLSIRSIKDKKIRWETEDVTGYCWISYLKKDVLIYSVGPLYGKPGIFAVYPDTGIVEKILKPKKFSKAYPMGMEYFKVLRIDGDEKLIYSYVKNVDDANFQEQLENQYSLSLSKSLGKGKS